MATISTLAVNLIARTSVFEKNIRKSRKKIKEFTVSIKKTSASVKKFGKVLKTALAPALSIVSFGLRKVTQLAKWTAAALIGISIASVKIAADVIETDNLFKISMGSMAKEAQSFATTYSNSLGLFENDTRKAMGTFNLILTSMGIAEDKSFAMSKGLVKLTNDISSFRNIKPEDVFLKLQGGITGEIRPLRNIGILINETTIKALALKDANIKARVATQKLTITTSSQVNGAVRMAKATRSQTLVLTEIEKVMLRYKAIVAATDRDQGDMKRTLDDTANVFRVIVAQIKVTANTIGKVLLPEVTKIAIAMRDWLINNQATIEKWAIVAKTSIIAVVNKLKEYFALAKAGNFEAIFRDMGKIFGNLIQGLIAVFEKIKPFAVDLGSQIAVGFLDAVRETKLGKFVAGAKDVAGNIAAPFTIGREAGRLGFANKEGRRIESVIGSIRDRATGKFNPNRNDLAILQELKLIREATQENVRRF